MTVERKNTEKRKKKESYRNRSTLEMSKGTAESCTQRKKGENQSPGRGKTRKTNEVSQPR